jgi:hypothetical protein
MHKGARLGAFLVSIIRSLSGYSDRSFEGMGVLHQAAHGLLVQGSRLISCRCQSSRSPAHRKRLPWRYASRISEACRLALCKRIHKKCICLAIHVFKALGNGVDLKV